MFFSVGNGFTDVIPHQIVRANTDRLYVFSGQANSTLIFCYWTAQPGLPGSMSDFNLAAQLTASDMPISIETIYDGANTIHVLANFRSSGLKDYPFNIATNTFSNPITLAADNGTLTGDYIGTSGVSGMIDSNGLMHVVYWNRTNHIIHLAYTYDQAANTLTQVGNSVQMDIAGNANHPAVAVSPLNNS